MAAATIMVYFRIRMKIDNTIGNDKYFHCMTSCALKRAVGDSLSRGVMAGWERFQFDKNVFFGNDPWSELDQCLKDEAANEVGRNVAAYQSCHDGCKHLYPSP
ncbi:MAG: hypothetical protein ACREQV_06620 [Candidatus Binatia bacterium]